MPSRCKGYRLRCNRRKFFYWFHSASSVDTLWTWWWKVLLIHAVSGIVLLHIDNVAHVSPAAVKFGLPLLATESRLCSYQRLSAQGHLVSGYSGKRSNSHLDFVNCDLSKFRDVSFQPQQSLFCCSQATKMNIPTMCNMSLLLCKMHKLFLVQSVDHSE